MATSASQPYIARLGFQDPDRSKDRHGLACEYLFERLLHVAAGPYITNEERERLSSLIKVHSTGSRWLDAEEKVFAAERAPIELAALTDEYGIKKALNRFLPANCINVPISNDRGFTSGFADVLLTFDTYACFLGEVKITRQPAEQVLQQINFYKNQLECSRRWVCGIYILTDYDCTDLQRLTQGSDVKVYRLGQRFEQWLVNRSTPETPEL